MSGPIQTIRRGIGAVAIALLSLSLGVRTDQAAPAVVSTAGLPDLFTPAAGVLQDRNGDGLIDFVNARIVLGSAPSASDVSAGADIAARLGYETSAMDIPLPDRPGAVAIAIGAAGAKAAGLDRPMPALGPGEGLVESITARGGARIIVVAGGDEGGTRAAAEWVAERLPHVWDPNGPTLDAAAAQIRSALTKGSVSVTNLRVPAVHVHAGRAALDRIDVIASFASAADAARAAAALRAPALSIRGVAAVRLTTEPASPKPIDVIVSQPPSEAAAVPARPGAGAKEALSLANTFAIDGLLGDSDNNLLPDRLDVLLSPSGEGTSGTVDVAARLGLESTGVTLPIALPADQIKNPSSLPTLVLIGIAHPLVDELAKEGKFVRPNLQAGEGLIQVVKKAFGEKSAIVVTGADSRGLQRALVEMAQKLPHIWARGKDRTTIGDVQEDVRRFLAGRTPAGQAAMALYKLDKVAETLRGKDLRSATVKVSLEKPAEGFGDIVRQAAAAKIKADTVDVGIENRDVQHAKTIFSDDFDVPSEVDEFWTVFRSKVLPAVRKGQPVAIEARLSEAPELRAAIERQAREELVKAGADAAQTRVVVLSAYKQGYSWLYDVVRPQLEGKAVDKITIRFARIGAISEWKQQSMFVPTRWLQELFPIDEILARELKIGVDHIQFEERPIGSPTYEVVAATAAGKEVYRATFDPKFVVRSFFDVFPTYEKVRVTTGWLSATIRGQQVVDQRIETDPERLWDRFQAKTLPAIYMHEMLIAKGKPRPEDAPFFGTLTIDVTLSEPNYRLNLGNEQIASLESLQEELYFNTLHFFDVLGREARGPALDYVGRVIPIVRPKQDGKAGHASISFTGFDASRPSVIVAYVERNGTAGEVRLDIPKIATESPVALSAHVMDGRDGLESLDVRLKVDTANDDREQMVKGASAEQVDQRILSAAQVGAVVDNLNRLRTAGLYRDALAYHDLRRLRIVTGLTFDPKPSADLVLALDDRGAPPPWPDIRTLLPAGFKYDGSKPLVQWETPIPPPEGAQILATMSTFPEATVYKVGESYLGKDSWAMDLMPRVEASHWSQAKQSTLKPTIVYSARQDANEVSSTSHTLKLAEMLLTDPQFKPDLKKLNVVFHPFTNPDGAQLAYDLYKITPDYMLHPGYLGSLGVSLVSRWDADPVYPESRIRPKLWRTWLPDIFLNPHGYPSHEWVQLFSEYVPWVRSRVSDAHGWWGMRGWFIPGFNYLDDPRYPRNKDAVMRIRQLITRNMNAVPEVKSFNEAAYARYRKYTAAFNEDDFKMEFSDGVLIYTSIKGARADGAGRGGRGDGGGGDDYMTRQPNITIFFGSTEAPDETAYGPWMKLVATMGLQWDKAQLESLLEGNHVVERKASSFFGGVSLSLDRPRPPKAATAAASPTGNDKGER